MNSKRCHNLTAASCGVLNPTANKFHSFIDFGSTGTRKGRANLAEEIFKVLEGGTRHPPAGRGQKIIQVYKDDTENFSAPVRKIISDRTVAGFCSHNKLFAEIITLDILDFIDGTQKQLFETGSPYNDEEILLDDVLTLGKNDFIEVWSGIESFIRDTYGSGFNIDFYTERFNKALHKPEGRRRKNNALTFHSIKNYFMEKWTKLLSRKKNIQEQEFINLKASGFLTELKRRIANLKTISKTLEPGSAELGRLWNLSKGKWQKSSYDVLSSYSEYFTRDITLRELARSLGRSHETEVETEEEIYSDRGFEEVLEIDENGRLELCGIHESGDISALLPVEIALLSDSTAELLFYKKFAEHKLQTWQYQDKRYILRETDDAAHGKRKKREAEGPFILCIDTSGSMRGDAERVAKTLVFALLKFALKQKRLCYLISFSTQIETLEISDLGANIDKLCEFLTMNFYGGSNAAPAFTEALLMLEREAYRKADIVMVSDFILPRLDTGIEDRMKNARSQKTLFHGILIGDLGDNAVNRALLDNFDTSTVYDFW
jgi:uncharacterized protein with von Willebrand factor type A (vWA) domain